MTDWTQAKIKTLLEKNDRAVERALVVLYDRQTEDEKRADDTKHHNNRGFTQADARFMSSMARQVLRGVHLSARQLAFLRGRRSTRFHSRIGKYSRQLLEVAEAKAAS